MVFGDEIEQFNLRYSFCSFSLYPMDWRERKPTHTYGNCRLGTIDLNCATNGDSVNNCDIIVQE